MRLSFLRRGCPLYSNAFVAICKLPPCLCHQIVTLIIDSVNSLLPFSFPEKTGNSPFFREKVREKRKKFPLYRILYRGNQNLQFCHFLRCQASGWGSSPVTGASGSAGSTVSGVGVGVGAGVGVGVGVSSGSSEGVGVGSGSSSALLPKMPVGV